MNAREERGLVIAALCKLNKTADCWLVPSQSSELIYRVNVEKQTCTCPDHQEAGFKCKHLYAVEFTIKREVHPDGSVTDTKTLTFTEKIVYKQDWPAYNHAQSIEKDRLQELLFDLCQGVPEPERSGRGPQAAHGQGFGLRVRVQGVQHGQQPPLLLRPPRGSRTRLPVAADHRPESAAVL